jgi:phosphoribosylaminoimidazolecarboxamide formyltransferase/IMP cyclohydrolase
VLNQPVDLKTAKAFAAFKESNGVLIDIVAAPGVTSEAAGFIQTTRKTTGIYSFGKIPKRRTNNQHLRFFDGGFIVQDWDDKYNFEQWKVVGRVKPSKKQVEQARIAWKFISRIRSNTVIIVDPELPMTRGIGSGQTSRVKSTELAIQLAGKHARAGILASDSFFPFDDSVKLAAKAKIGLIVEQGGSRNDQASIDAANEADIPIIFTGERRFWH